MGLRRTSGVVLSVAVIIAGVGADRMIPDPSPAWVTAAIWGTVVILVLLGAVLAFWREGKKMSDAKKPRPGTVGIRIGPNASRNTFIGFRMRGIETAIENDGDGNNFIDFDVDAAPEAGKDDPSMS